MKALIVLDLQNDFCNPSGSMYTQDNEAVIDRVNELLPNYSLIIFTKDYHTQYHCSIYPDHCVQGTPGCSLVSNIQWPAIPKDFYIINKGEHDDVDSPSPFYNNDGHISTILDAMLTFKGVTSLDIIGVGHGIEKTSAHAFALGYDNTIL